jgi:alcohol dehydrogenase YqhD (iron-dependent ADH family)
MKAGIYDIMNHIMEQYFSDFDDNTSDYLAEGLMRSVIHSSRIAVKNPQDYEARSNIMWTATWALNKLIAQGKPEDWEVHMIGQAVGAHTNATHGMTLSAVSLPFYRHVMQGGLHRFVRFAKNVWGICADGKTDQQVADEGLAALEAWMREIGVVMNISELGATEEMLPKIADSTFLLTGGYRELTRDEVIEILKESL